MVAIPGQFDDSDDAPDPVAMRRTVMLAILSAASGALQLAALNLKRMTELELKVGEIDDSAADLAMSHVAQIESAAALLTDSAKIYQEPSHGQ